MQDLLADFQVAADKGAPGFSVAPRWFSVFIYFALKSTDI
jgi:hypothetical protein